MTRKQYKKPPLVEVFSEFFFQPEEGKEWDSFVTPSFYKKFEKRFPTRKRFNAVGYPASRSRWTRFARVSAVRPSDASASVYIGR